QRLSHGTARAATRDRGAAAPRLALELHRHRGVHLVGGQRAGALRGRSAAAVGAGALHQPRSGAADADGARQHGLHARYRRAGHLHPRLGQSEPAPRPGGGWRAVLARGQPPVAQLPVHDGREPGYRRRRAARHPRAVRAQQRRRRQAADRSAALGTRAADRAPPAGCRRAQLRPRHRARDRSGRARLRGRERLPVWRGAAAVPGTVRVDQLLRRSRAALGEPRRNQPMGAGVGQEADTVGFLSALEREPYRYDFYQVMRRFECANRDLPRWGMALRPRDEPVRLGQDPELTFAPAPLSSFAPGGSNARARLAVRLFGLLGPNGPLPLHLTEYARERLMHAGDRTFARFLEMLSHRFVALFYRAWAQSQPTVMADRPVEDRFRAFVGAFIGIMPPAFRERGAVLGRKVYDRQCRFRLELGPLSRVLYESFLPSGKLFRPLIDWVRNYVGFEYAWDVRLSLAADEVPVVMLGGAGQLGWTTWLGLRPLGKPAEDLVLNAEAALARVGELT